MNERTQRVKSKGFDMAVGRTGAGSDDYVIPVDSRNTDYANIKVGLKTLKHALTDINYYQKVNSAATKENILTAISNNNIIAMREYVDYFYRSSGIFARLCRYMAYLYRYDWLVTPIVLDTKIKNDKVIEGFYKSLATIDSFNAKQTFGDIALKVVKNGCFYGYKIEENGKTVIQELPLTYCRSRFFSNGKPVVEFNVRYFDDTFRDSAQKMKILSIFPPEIAKGWVLYREGKLVPDFAGDQQGWYLLDVNKTVKFNLNGNDAPLLVATLPAIIDLEEAQELDRLKMQQQLLRIIIQKMPLDKNGELIFDVDEAKALHNNAVAMLGQAIGLDVLTTFAEVDVADLSDRSTTTSVDEIMKVERAVYNEAGISQMQFNTDGNLALEKSIANDEASMFNLLMQFEVFLNELLQPFNTKPKRIIYKAQMLTTTIYNYKELSKIYKEQMQIGFSKMLPQIALGQSQSSILATAYFENEVLDLNSIFTPPAMSSTTSGGAEKGTPGRKPLPDEEKSEKTIQNKESMG